MRSNGVEAYGPTRFDWMKAISYYFYDPDDNLLEFWSPVEQESGGRGQKQTEQLPLSAAALLNVTAGMGSLAPTFLMERRL